MKKLTCRDCIHYDICGYHITEMTTMTIEECSHGFKNKADFVEVVRCKDCKYSSGSSHHCDKGYSTLVYPDHFCNSGKRRAKVTLDSVLEMIRKEYEAEKRKTWVTQPLSNALYNTWVFVSKNEENTEGDAE